MDIMEKTEKTENSKKVYIFRGLVILWMVVIFVFSAADGDESSKTSGWVGRMIGSILHSDFEDWTEEEQQAYAEKIEYPIRKTAHATEYAVLALLFFGALTFEGKKRYIFSWIFTVIYACTDEFHQLFVPGRAGRLFDVGVDSLGALAGLLILAGCRALWLRRKNRQVTHPQSQNSPS